MTQLPRESGYFVLLVALVLAAIETFAEDAHDLTMLIWSLLVLGAVIVLAGRDQPS